MQQNEGSPAGSCGGSVLHHSGQRLGHTAWELSASGQRSRPSQSPLPQSLGQGAELPELSYWRSPHWGLRAAWGLPCSWLRSIPPFLQPRSAAPRAAAARSSVSGVCLLPSETKHPVQGSSPWGWASSSLQEEGDSDPCYLVGSLEDAGSVIGWSWGGVSP